MKLPHDPVSVIASAAGSLVVRIVSFFVGVWVSMIMAAWVVSGQFPHVEPVLIPFGWLVTVFLGLCQWWGFLAYGPLAVLFIVQVHEEKPLPFTLAPAVVVQAIETTRFALHGEQSWPTRALVFLAILGALLSAMAILYVRRTSWLGRPNA